MFIKYKKYPSYTTRLGILLTFIRFQMCTNRFWEPRYSNYHVKLHKLFSVFNPLIKAELVILFQFLRFSFANVYILFVHVEYVIL